LRYSAMRDCDEALDVRPKMGTWMLCRLIHSAVLPDSVSATMALQPRWWAVNSAPMAIDWSMRPNTRSVKFASSRTSSARSASSAICAICSTVSTGYLPAAVSADSITASVPSSTALATSLTSARVGTGLTIMLSIICVAVMAILSISRAMRIIRFCRAGTAALPTSTARSPRATMMPSLALRMASS